MELRFKSHFYELMERGCLGNTLRNWRTIQDAWDAESPYYGFREIGIAGGGLHSVVPRSDLFAKFNDWSHAGRRFIMDEAAPDTDVQLQGEICQGIFGWEGYLGIRTGLRMRPAMAAGCMRPYRGLSTRTIVRSFCCENSFGDIECLFDLYPDATIEFATYPYDLGKIPRRNTLIWELRNY